MKKVYSILALVLSSFFLFSLKEVKAISISEVPVVAPSSTSNFVPFEFYEVSGTGFYSNSRYSSLIPVSYFTSRPVFCINPNSGDFLYYITYLDVNKNKLGYYNPNHYFRGGFACETFSFSSDTFYILFNGNLTSISNLNNFLWIGNSDNVLSSVSDYVDYAEVYIEPEPVDPTPELTSFYTTVVDKISYLCSYMATNTLFLAMFVIIIFIVIIELIFRRRL